MWASYVLSAAALLAALAVVGARDATRGAAALWIMAGSLSGVFALSGDALTAAVYLFAYSGASVLLFLAALALERAPAGRSWRGNLRAWFAAAVAAFAGLGLAAVVFRNPSGKAFAAGAEGNPLPVLLGGAEGNPLLALAACSCLAAAACIAVVAITAPAASSPAPRDSENR
jgi:NADH:ubiquinone oxidoreductase subunit 6 (subunit J)